MNNDDRIFLRPASRVDAQAIHDLRMALIAETFPNLAVDCAAEFDQLTQLLTDPGPSAVWVSELAGDIVGYVRADSLGAGFNRMLALIWLGVAPAMRRRGYATKLVNAAIGDLPAYILSPTEPLASQTPGALFLAAQGFQPANDVDPHALAKHLKLQSVANPMVYVR